MLKEMNLNFNQQLATTYRELYWKILITKGLTNTDNCRKIPTIIAQAHMKLYLQHIKIMKVFKHSFPMVYGMYLGKIAVLCSHKCITLSNLTSTLTLLTRPTECNVFCTFLTKGN